MKPSRQATLARRITAEGRREFYYYGGKLDEFQSAAREGVSSFGIYELDPGTQHDSQWNQYFNVLYPSPENLQQILNRQVLDVMEREGD